MNALKRLLLAKKFLAFAKIIVSKLVVVAKRLPVNLPQTWIAAFDKQRDSAEEFDIYLQLMSQRGKTRSTFSDENHAVKVNFDPQSFEVGDPLDNTSALEGLLSYLEKNPAAGEWRRVAKILGVNINEISQEDPNGNKIPDATIGASVVEAAEVTPSSNPEHYSEKKGSENVDKLTIKFKIDPTNSEKLLPVFKKFLIELVDAASYVLDNPDEFIPVDMGQFKEEEIDKKTGLPKVKPPKPIKLNKAGEPIAPRGPRAPYGKDELAIDPKTGKETREIVFPSYITERRELEDEAMKNVQRSKSDSEKESIIDKFSKDIDGVYSKAIKSVNEYVASNLDKINKIMTVGWGDEPITTSEDFFSKLEDVSDKLKSATKEQAKKVGIPVGTLKKMAEEMATQKAAKDFYDEKDIYLDGGYRKGSGKNRTMGILQKLEYHLEKKGVPEVETMEELTEDQELEELANQSTKKDIEELQKKYSPERSKLLTDTETGLPKRPDQLTPEQLAAPLTDQELKKWSKVDPDFDANYLKLISAMPAAELKHIMKRLKEKVEYLEKKEKTPDIAKQLDMVHHIEKITKQELEKTMKDTRKLNKEESSKPVMKTKQDKKEEEEMFEEEEIPHDDFPDEDKEEEKHAD